MLFSLTSQLFFDLLASAVLSLHEVELALLSCLLLLPLDHIFHVASTLLFHCPLFFVHLASSLFLLFSIICDHLLLLLRRVLTILHSLITLLLRGAIHLAFHSLIHLLLAHAILFGVLRHDVPLPLTDDLIRSLPRLIDLLDNLSVLTANSNSVKSSKCVQSQMMIQDILTLIH